MDRTPLPVDVVPSWTWGLAEVIALVGAFGTILVALWALVLTKRLADRDHGARQRQSRVAFLNALDEVFSVIAGAPPRNPGEAASLLQVHGPALHRAAAESTDDARDVARWILTDIRATAARLKPGWGGVARADDVTRLGWQVWGYVAGGRVREWARTGRLDGRPIFDDDGLVEGAGVTKGSARP